MIRGLERTASGLLLSRGLMHPRTHKTRRVGTIDGTSSAASITSHASANTKATSYTTIFGDTTIEADGFYLQILRSTANRDFLVDIAIGAASSEVNILSNVMVSNGSIANGHASEVYIPIPVRESSRISARCQAGTGSSSLFVGVELVASRFATRGLRRATTYGANTADSGGQSVDAGGSANTLGAWAQLTAATTADIEYLIYFVGAGNNFVRALANMTFELGVGPATETMVLGGMYTAQNAGDDDFNPSYFSRYVSIPAGTRLSARVQCSTTDAADRLADVSVIGFD